ncbi:MAG: BatA domain-containing protein [Chitinophagales bacterium]|nr:BatA domain-containing protein [Chitinophagales bacterium]
MSFLYPTILFAFSAIAIPIIIHLFNFRRYKTIYFTNVRFLRDVKEKTDARSRLKHLLVLLCRILAIVFLIFAFAQPYIKNRTISQAVGRKAISIFIDNSFSMGQLASDVPLLEQAKLKAKQIVDAYSQDDQFQLLTEDFEGRHQRLVDKNEMYNLIKEIHLSPDTKYLSEIIARQKVALYKSNSPAKLLYVLSDYQKNFSDISNLKQDTSLQVSLVPISTAENENVYIDTCWLQSPVQIKGQPSLLFVQITNNSNHNIDNGRLTLKINNEIKAISNFSANLNTSIIDTLLYTITDNGWNQGELSIVDHPITFDDAYYFSYQVAEHLKVLVINESGNNPYLNAFFEKNSFFQTESSRLNQINYADLPGQQLIILNGIKELSTGLSAELKKFIAGSGNLIVFPDEGISMNSYNQFLQSVNADQLKDFTIRKKTVNRINTQDQLFADIFQQIPENLFLPEANASFTLTNYTATNASQLLKFSDGTSFVSKYHFGNGTLYLFAVPLDKKNTDLPLNPLFAPMLYKMAVSKEFFTPNSYIIGKNSEITVNSAFTTSDHVLHLKSNEDEFIPQQRLINNAITLLFGNDIKHSGFYALQDQAGTIKAQYALNYDRKESDLKFLSLDDLKKSGASLGIKILENSKRNLQEVIQGQHLGLPLWKVSIIFVLIFIALEILLLKFWK